MNLIEGRLTAGEDGTFTSTKGLALPVGPVPATLDGKPVVCGFRPEHLVAGDMIEAIVSVSEPTGSETLILAQAGGEAITVFVRDRMDVRHGDRISLAIGKQQLHFFAPETGRRLELETAADNLKQTA